MRLLQRLSRVLRGDVTWTPLDDHWDTPTGRPSAAGVPVTHERALGLPTAYSCVKVIAETVATLPLLVYREVPSGKQRAVDHPLYRLLRRRPNRWQHSLAFREMMTGHAALRGTAYAEMVGQTREDLELIPRHPARVRVPEVDDAGFPVVYLVRSGTNPVERPVSPRRMFVLQGPWGGRSPVEAHRDAIGLGLALQEYAARFFANGSRPSGVLQAPQGASLTKEQRERIKESWEAAHRGPALSHRIAVLEAGLQWQQVGFNAEESQLLQSRQFHIGDICRIWNVPPYKVQEYGRATWGNSEQMAIDFVTSCMLSWCRRWEEAVSWSLIDEEEPIFAEFLLEGLLRGDTATRYAAYAIATGGRAWMSPNQVRERENMNKEPGLDAVATTAQGAAPSEPSGPTPPRRGPRPPDPDDEGDEDDEEQANQRAASADVWRAWAGAAADALVKAELRGLERLGNLEERDPAAFGDACRDFYLGKHREYVRHRLEEMQAVWRGAIPIEAAIATIVAMGATWATSPPRDLAARRTSILAVLTDGGTNALAA